MGQRLIHEVAVPTPLRALYAAPIAGVVGPADNVTSGLSIASSPIDIGVGLVMSQDNTLGAYARMRGGSTPHSSAISMSKSMALRILRATPTSS